MFMKDQILTYLTLLAFTIHNTFAIECYQCSSTNSKHPFQCNEFQSDDTSIEQMPCDAVHGAQFCIKHVGRFEASSIKCYQCTGNNLDCSDGMIHISDLEPQNCDHVFEAQYCIKSTSLDGGIGTKRFCSSLNLGNYCNFVRQPGDKLQYRTCIFTCTGDGCNTSQINKPSVGVMSITVLTTFLVLISIR